MLARAPRPGPAGICLGAGRSAQSTVAALAIGALLLTCLGPELGLAALIGAFVAIFVSYAVAASTAQRLSPRVVFTTILALHAIVLFAPPLFSSDVFSYTAYARIGAVYGANPYLHGPASFPLDALHPLIGVEWIETPTVYGPLFTALSYRLVPFGIAANVLAYKLVAAASSLALVYLVWRAARLRGLDGTRAAALVGLNPVIVLSGVGGGHNDLLMLAILFAGLRPSAESRGLERRPDGRRRRGEADRRADPPLRPRRRPSARSLGYRPPPPGRRRPRRRRAPRPRHAFFGTGPLAILGTLQGIQSQGGPHSVVGFLASALGADAITSTINSVLGGVFVVILAWLLRKVWTGELDWIAGAGWATVALLLTTGFSRPPGTSPG